MVRVYLLALLSLGVASAQAPYKVERLRAAPINVLGEGPHWDHDRQSLYYVDIYGGRERKASLHRYDFSENKVYSANIKGEQVVGFMIPVAGRNDEFIVGAGTRLLLIQWDGKSPRAKRLRILGEVDENKKGITRFNDGKADPAGRLFAGTMQLDDLGNSFAAREGTFYRYTTPTGFVPLKQSVGISNGMAWNNNKFYYIDSNALDVKEYDYDPSTGNISNERVLINLDTKVRPPAFAPDGMTIDNQGNLYVATFGGSKVLKINPTTRRVEMEINIPTEQVTSVAFGGPHLDTLFVTTASRNRKPPPAGGVFKVTGLGAQGLPMNRAVV